MTATAQSFTMWQGETTRLRVPITNKAGAALSLTGATITWSLFTNKSAAAPVLTKTTASSGGISLADSNAADEVDEDEVVIELVKSDTAELAATDYYHECRAVDASGDEQVLFIGDLYLKKSKTVS